MMKLDRNHERGRRGVENGEGQGHIKCHMWHEIGKRERAGIGRM